MRPVPALLAIVDPLSLGGELDQWLAEARRAKLPAVLARDRHRCDRDRLAGLEQIVGHNVFALTSGRADLALAAGAGGVHLPNTGVAVGEIRSLLGSGPLVGRSTHSIEEVEEAASQGADYVVFGPVWATPGKGPPVGLQSLARVCRLGLPVLALGGVETSRLQACRDAGAAGVAAIRWCHDAAALAAATRAVRAVFGPLPAAADSRSNLPPPSHPVSSSQ